MKLKTTTEKIVCSVPGCGNMAAFKLSAGVGEEFICKDCAKALYAELAGVSFDGENDGESSSKAKKKD